MFVLLAIAVTGMTQGVKAQSVAVKSNMLADAFLNPNLGMEVGLAPKWTLDITGQFNDWGGIGTSRRRWASAIPIHAMTASGAPGAAGR